MSPRPVPACAVLWEPPAPGTRIERPRLSPTSSSPSPAPKPDPFADVELDICDACGWRFGPNPTRCRCIGSTPRTAPPRAPEQDWRERAYG